MQYGNISIAETRKNKYQMIKMEKKTFPFEMRGKRHALIRVMRWTLVEGASKKTLLRD